MARLTLQRPLEAVDRPLGIVCAQLVLRNAVLPAGVECRQPCHAVEEDLRLLVVAQGDMHLAESG